jgi:hypothetical protein
MGTWMGDSVGRGAQLVEEYSQPILDGKVLGDGDT